MKLVIFSFFSPSVHLPCALWDFSFFGSFHTPNHIMHCQRAIGGNPNRHSWPARYREIGSVILEALRKSQVRSLLQLTKIHPPTADMQGILEVLLRHLMSMKGPQMRPRCWYPILRLLHPLEISFARITKKKPRQTLAHIIQIFVVSLWCQEPNSGNCFCWWAS